MKVQIYILGFLIRYGSLHGYKIKRLISERASDFANIKLPTLYYHLEKLQKAGLVTAQIEKKGRRPDRMVYSITDSGRAQFVEMLRETLQVPYRAEFVLDAALFFFESLRPVEMADAFKAREGCLKEVLDHINKHFKEVMAVVPENFKWATAAIFKHHFVHLEAELKWVQETSALLKKRENGEEGPGGTILNGT